ncbi:MAG: hypothetical protein J6Y78_15235 [Paludibacteraceae bacterium]|nr:hypothetical protein [Paludibacteraceae bacterium]
MMKAFVYRKSDSKRVEVIVNVICVKRKKSKNLLSIETRDLGTFEYDTRIYKISIFQN